jgi:hypothetical protein
MVYLDLLCDVGQLRYTLQNVRSLCVFRAAAAKSAWNEMHESFFDYFDYLDVGK